MCDVRVALKPHSNEPTSTDDTHGKDRIVRNFVIGIVREFTQRIDDVQFGIRYGEQRERKGYSAFNHRFTVS